jgi:hypothetical protein
MNENKNKLLKPSFRLPILRFLSTATSPASILANNPPATTGVAGVIGAAAVGVAVAEVDMVAGEAGVEAGAESGRQYFVLSNI